VIATPSGPPPTGTVAIVPAYNRHDTVAATVRAIRAIDGVDSVLVVDDGSTDATASQAQSAGASVERIERNVGKGGAVARGIEVSGAPQCYLLLDADLGESARHATALLEPVVSGTAAMSVGTFPESGRSRGFGLVKRAAATIVERATGLEMTEPLSGQRAIAGSVLRSVEPAPRFGLEIGLTLDIAARGHHIVEVSAEFEHRPTGRDLAGVMHRMRQGRDLVGAAWRRIGWRRTISSLVRSIWRRR